MTIHFTSDTHFLHANIIEYSKRPFSCLEEMTESLVENWNQCVKKGDTIYHLGDFAISYGKKDSPKVDALLGRLNGHKHLIIGNHDRKEVLTNARWASVQHYKEIKVDTGGIHKQRIVMMHYCLRTWDQMHRGAIMLHGHSHGSLSDIGGKVMDVGVDANSYRPVDFDFVIGFMKDREITTLDHHAHKDIEQ